MGCRRRLSGSYHLLTYICSLCSLPFAGQALTFTSPEGLYSCSSTLRALTGGRLSSELSRVGEEPGGRWHISAAPSPQEAGEFPPVLKDLRGCQPAQGRIHMSAQILLPPSSRHWLACLFIRSEGQEAAQSSSLLQHLLPRDQDSAVGDAVAASPESPCLLRELRPLADYPRISNIQSLLHRDNHRLGLSQTGEAF